MIRSLIILTLIATASLQAQDLLQNAPSGQESGTLALWKFDDVEEPGLNSADAAFPLSFSRSKTEVGSGVPGRFGSGFRSLGGSNGEPSQENDAFAEARNSAALFHESALTVDFWYHPQGSNLQGTLFDKKRNEPAGISLFVSRNNSLVLEVGNGSRSEQLVIPQVEWPPENWVHLAATFENKGSVAELKLYVNGLLLAEKKVEGFGDMAAGAHPWRIANRRVATYTSRPGLYDNFRISSRALTFQP